MTHLEVLSSLLIIFFSFSSCDKKSDQAKIATKAELIVDKNWVVTAATVQVNNEPALNVFADLKDCEKDDITRFAKNGTYESREGATTCHPTDPPVSSQGTWTITQDNLTITEPRSSFRITYKILELGNTTLTISSTVPRDATGSTYTSTYTYAAQ
ncbi:lipocalin-like domain-containing protein [Adhaeribacter pallidiroseus]|uniref:Lipocalin-like domain-containing protein n=1 Tax=Adhaeribacter pallidiroseus TaxID=2072847 RepID=A0A369QTK6_9BACT|nr:lipocalin family protein [Adhaeribacter pallidiroseus]RDC66517.1 hypothetical protein AHMF7616_05148 [Adhaeribacter pallidiroseus]